MKCPIIISAMELKGGLYDAHTNECLKEECAWWEGPDVGCAVLLISLRLGTLCDVLTEVADKMPHEGHFRR